MNDTPGMPPDDDIQSLAGEYVLGTLSAEQRADVQARLEHDAALRKAVDEWENRLLALTDLAEPKAPPASLWNRIEHTLDALSAAPRAHASAHVDRVTRWWDSLDLWRGIAGVGVAASVALAAVLITQLAAKPVPSYLVVLVAPQDKAPGWVIQANDARDIQLIPLGETSIPEDKALQFWTKADDWQGPVSLGLVKPGQVLSVPLDSLPPLQPNQLFELTLEKSTGSPINKPTGPIQFIGRAVKVI
ncbi:anti-sigma factor [Pseudomonas sp. UBA1879]|uniref:anti-sigma factor n=1 Tax=Pseudomonas sp. UBA1879 TaxID=1947305 RepID=UPI0032E3B494